MKRKTKRQIIKETFNYYRKDVSRRSVGYYGDYGDELRRYQCCRYNSADGRHCAVGRVLKAQYRKQGVNLSCNQEGLSKLVSRHLGLWVYDKNTDIYLDDMLKPSYRGHALQFWADIQGLHDGEAYWSDNDVTDTGIKRMKELLHKYDNQTERKR